jgi:hypothetical protein
MLVKVFFCAVWKSGNSVLRCAKCAYLAMEVWLGCVGLIGGERPVSETIACERRGMSVEKR